MAGPRRRLLSSLRYMDAMIMVFLACGLAFLSPMIYLWARGDFPWYKVTNWLIWAAPPDPSAYYGVGTER